MIFILLSLLLVLLLLVSFFIGLIVMGLTAPVYRRTGYGFVPHTIGDSDRDERLGIRRTLRHVLVGALYFSLTFTIAFTLGIYVSGTFILTIPLIPAAVWVLRIAVPIRGREECPDRWVRRSLGSVAVYIGAYVLGAGSLFGLFGALA